MLFLIHLACVATRMSTFGTFLGFDGGLSVSAFMLSLNQLHRCWSGHTSHLHTQAQIKVGTFLGVLGAGCQIRKTEKLAVNASIENVTAQMIRCRYWATRCTSSSSQCTGS